MARNSTRKQAVATASEPDSNTLDSGITLGDEELTIAPTTTLDLTIPYPEDPLIDSQPSQSPPLDILAESQAQTQEKETLSWSFDMIQVLIDTLEEVFQNGGAADNSFKKSTFKLAATQVCQIYTGMAVVNGEKCKNKWADFKAKWAHWKDLSEMSGFGWNEEKELYEAHDYVWDALNKSHPSII
jgi:hypothetical protein